MRYYLARARFIMHLRNSLRWRLAVLLGVAYSPSWAVVRAFYVGK